MGGDGVVSIPSSVGVTKLPIGSAQQVLRVSDDGNRPVWSRQLCSGGVNVGAAAPPYDFTGTWSEGRYRLATHIENATDYPHAANKGTYTSGHQMSKDTEALQCFIGQMENLMLLHGDI